MVWVLVGSELAAPTCFLTLSFTVVLSWPRSTDATTGLKLYLTLVANQPVRRLLFYILKYEFVAQMCRTTRRTATLGHISLRLVRSKEAFQTDLKQLCEQYLFNMDSFNLSLNTFALCVASLI